jgi:kynurenine formamidase
VTGLERRFPALDDVGDHGAGAVKLIDLSVPLMVGGGEPISPSIQYHDHLWGAGRMALLPAQDKRSIVRSALNFLRSAVAGTRIKRSDFPDGMALAWETIKTDPHHGTHVDAPWHYGPSSEGLPARTIDQLPLDWFVRPGVRLDLRHKEPGSTITVSDLERALGTIDYSLQPMDIVLLWTGVDALWGTPEYFENYSGLDRESTLWLLDQGIKVIGTDAWSVDRPPMYIGRDFARTGDSRYLWPAHFVGREREYSQIEKLANLGDLPRPTGFTVVALPVKIKGASAGWSRVVAITE